MASTFKNLSPNDKISTKTLLHEAIPLTGTILSGTYGTNNIKDYSHGMFQSVFDYPYLSSSANHIFDITSGFANDSALSASTSTAAAQRAKKINIYNQMAQVLVGYDKTGSIQQFDEDGNLADGTKLKENVFLSFSRLLVKDEIKRGSFQMILGVNSDYSNPFTKTIKIADTGADTTYKINSPVGEYGILYATNNTGTPLASSDVKCGLIYYQAGVIALSSSVFGGSTASGSATLTYTGQPADAQTITLIPADGTSKTYEFDSGGASTGATSGGSITNGNVAVAIGGNADTTYGNLIAAINHSNGHNTGTPNSKITITNNTSDGTSATGNIVLTQTVGDHLGNTVITENAANLTVTNFSGGGSGGILSSSLGAPKMLNASYANSLTSVLTGSSISNSANALRHRIKNIQFNNTVELNSSIYFCRINHNEYNYSANPTYLSASQIRVKQQASDVPISYITTVGLYSADNQLLAVGKLSEPLRKDPTIEYTLRARLDY